jgi:ribosomal protein S18 acetylase RimI-like enzyme
MRAVAPADKRSPPPRWAVRAVQLSDVEALVYDCWGDRPYQTIYEMVTSIQRMQDERRGVGLVACVPHLPLACAYAQLLTWATSHGDRRNGEITDVIVAQAWRRRGIASTLVRHLIRAAGLLRVHQLEIGVYQSNHSALLLYQRLGFVIWRETLTHSDDGPQPAYYLRMLLP